MTLMMLVVRDIAMRIKASMSGRHPKMQLPLDGKLVSSLVVDFESVKAFFEPSTANSRVLMVRTMGGKFNGHQMSSPEHVYKIPESFSAF